MRIINNLRSIVRRATNDEAGVTAVEYGILASLIALAIVTAVTGLGTDLSTLFTSVGGKM
jgi:pilus assembly protein Flp/PilA